jgi:hypothetical protein
VGRGAPALLRVHGRLSSPGYRPYPLVTPSIDESARVAFLLDPEAHVVTPGPTSTTPMLPKDEKRVGIMKP